MFVMDCYGHKLSNGVLFAHHLILGVPGGSSHLAYRRRVPLGHNPPTRVKGLLNLALTRYWVPLVHPMPRKGRRAAKAARAREEALKAERRMGEVLRGKELTEVEEFGRRPK